MDVFTPQNETRTKRLRIKIKDIEVVQGSLFARGLGKKAVIEVKGKRYTVMGISCGLPNCQCDSYLKEVKQ